MCGSLEKRGDGDRERERDRETDRDRPGFKGPSVSFGAVGPKKLKRLHLKVLWNEIFVFVFMI